MNAAEPQSLNASEIARRRFLFRHHALFLGDWLRAVFIHYEVDPEQLQRQVPFPLDLLNDRAYVSLVAFSMRRLRPACGGKLGEWLFLPIASHEFLNVRTYVRVQNTPGIFFMAEWLNNRWSVLLGPSSYGLPYRFGRVVYQHNGDDGQLAGRVESRGGNLSYTGQLAVNSRLEPCLRGSRDEFLLERYTAFTRHRGANRSFDIFHQPWPQTRLAVNIADAGLLAGTGSWFSHAKLVSANYSPGIRDIWMGWPRRLGNELAFSGGVCEVMSSAPKAVWPR